MMIKNGKTPKGFRSLKFKDYNKADCSIQPSFYGGDRCIWIGLDKATVLQMTHKKCIFLFRLLNDVITQQLILLTREQAGEIAKVLQHFSETGNLELEEGY